MARDRELRVVILGDAKGAQKAFAQLDQAAGGIGSKIGSVAKAVGVALVGAGTAATAFGVKAVLSASDLAETMSKVGVVFGDQQKIVTSFANQMAKDFGTPKREILDAAASIGLIGKASGLSQGDAAKMSTQLAKLATDAASFYNVPLPEALQAIQSGLVGEAEPMRRFGVLLNAQAVDAEAARLGLQKVNGEYTEGAKAQARASLIMAGMSDASGDLERTQGSLANRLKELRGRAANFAADVGTKLLPVVLDAFDLFERWGGTLKAKVEPILRTVGLGVRAMFAAFKDGDITSDGLVGAFERIGATARTVVLGVRALFAAFRDGDVTSDGFVGAMERIGVAVRAVVGFVQDNAAPVLAALAGIVATVVVPAFVAWAGAALAAAAAQLAAAAPAIALAAAVGAVAAGVVWAYQRFEGFRAVVDTVAGFLTGTAVPAVSKLASAVVDQLGKAVEWVQRIWPQVSEAIGHVLNVAAGVVRSFVAVVSAVWRAWGDDLLRIARTAFDYVRDTVDNVLQVVSGIIRAVLAVINGDWGKAWDGLRSVLSGVWDQIKNVVSTALDLVRSTIGGVLSTIAQIWSGAWEGIKSAGEAVLRTFVVTFLDAVEAIVGGAAKAFGWVPGIGGLLRSAASEVSAFRDQANAALGGIRPVAINVDTAVAKERVADLAAVIRRDLGNVLVSLPGPSGRVQARAHGGPVKRGQPYVVGELRPELFIPDVDGTILPRVPSSGGGGTSVATAPAPIVIAPQISVAGSVVAEQDLVANVIRAFEEWVRRNGRPPWLG